MKVFCQDCQEAQPASESGQYIPGTNRATYKRLDAHKHPKKQEVCDGSGKLV